MIVQARNSEYNIKSSRSIPTRVLSCTSFKLDIRKCKLVGFGKQHGNLPWEQQRFYQCQGIIQYVKLRLTTVDHNSGNHAGIIRCEEFRRTHHRFPYTVNPEYFVRTKFLYPWDPRPFVRMKFSYSR